MVDDPDDEKVVGPEQSGRNDQGARRHEPTPQQVDPLSPHSLPRTASLKSRARLPTRVPREYSILSDPPLLVPEYRERDSRKLGGIWDLGPGALRGKEGARRVELQAEREALDPNKSQNARYPSNPPLPPRPLGRLFLLATFPLSSSSCPSSSTLVVFFFYSHIHH